MTIKLVACDIDDTLVRFPNPPSSRVIRALRAASDAGVTVALVTGRAFRRALPIARSLNLTAPLICNHGGSIRDPLDGRFIHCETLPRAFMLQVVTWLQTQNVCMMLFDGDHVYRDCVTEQVVPDFHTYTGEDGSTFCRDPRFCIPEQTEILLASSLDHTHLHRVFERARARFGDQARVLFTHPFGIDILSQDATKSRSLAWLAEHIGVTQKEVMAVGDGHNDIDMLAWAGLGVAMGDGKAEAKAVAGVIAPSFAQDGAAWAIERYVLQAIAP
jgi:Cof subfamily protein (haloacid dehalogenase superfamily)